MGVKIELTSFAFVSMGMLVCFWSSASSWLTTLAFCVLFLTLSKYPSCVKMLPRYSVEFFHLLQLNAVDTDGKVAWCSAYLLNIVSVLLRLRDFLIVCFNVCVHAWMAFSSSLIRL